MRQGFLLRISTNSHNESQQLFHAGCIWDRRIPPGSRWLQWRCRRRLEWPLVNTVWLHMMSYWPSPNICNQRTPIFSCQVRGAWVRVLYTRSGQRQVLAQLREHVEGRLVVEVLWERSQRTLLRHPTARLCPRPTGYRLVQMEGTESQPIIMVNMWRWSINLPSLFCVGMGLHVEEGDHDDQAEELPTKQLLLHTLHVTIIRLIDN